MELEQEELEEAKEIFVIDNGESDNTDSVLEGEDRRWSHQQVVSYSLLFLSPPPAPPPPLVFGIRIYMFLCISIVLCTERMENVL